MTALDVQPMSIANPLAVLKITTREHIPSSIVTRLVTVEEGFQHYDHKLCCYQSLYQVLCCIHSHSAL